MTTIQLRNELAGSRRTVRVACDHDETVARLQIALKDCDFDLYGDAAAVYAVADGRHITVTVYGFCHEAALARLQEVLAHVRGRATA